MSLPMVLGIAQGAFSLIGGMAARRKAIQAANASYESTVAFTERDFGINLNDIRIAFDEVNNEAGMMLTDLGSEARAAAGAVTTALTEKNVFGATAERAQGSVEMREALQADRIRQQAESKMIDLQNEGRRVKYDRERRIGEAAQARTNAIVQQPSTFGIMANAVAAGIGGYQQGMSLQSARRQFDLQTQIADVHQTRLSELRTEAARWGIHNQ